MIMNFDRKTLREIVDNIEHINSQIDDLKLEAKAFYDTAKGAGMAPAVLRKVIARRRKDPEKIREEDELFDLYNSSLQGDLFAADAEGKPAPKPREEGTSVVSFGKS